MSIPLLLNETLLDGPPLPEMKDLEYIDSLRFAGESPTLDRKESDRSLSLTKISSSCFKGKLNTDS